MMLTAPADKSLTRRHDVAWFDRLTMSARREPLDSSLVLSLSSLDMARDDPEVLEGWKDERVILRLVERRVFVTSSLRSRRAP